MNRPENLFQPPEYSPEMFAEYFENEKKRALRISEIEAILGDDYNLDRLRELVEADRDGRCVVPPCKVGDCVWITSAYGKQYNPPIEGHIQKFVVHDDEIVYLEAIIWMDIGCGHKGYGYTEKSFGKAVFLTPEAAKATLKGEQHEN